MARSYNTARSKNDWTADRRAARAIKGRETQQARKHERRDIDQSMNGVTYGSFGETYDSDGFENYQHD